MRKRPERAGRISIQTLTISPMINVLNLVALVGIRPSPRGYKEEPEGAFLQSLVTIKLVAGAGFEPTTFGL